MFSFCSHRGFPLGKGLLPRLVDGATDADVETILRTLAERGNSARPVAARFQSRPKNVQRLLPQEAVVAASAASTCGRTNCRVASATM